MKKENIEAKFFKNDHEDLLFLDDVALLADVATVQELTNILVADTADLLNVGS